MHNMNIYPTTLTKMAQCSSISEICQLQKPGAIVMMPIGIQQYILLWPKLMHILYMHHTTLPIGPHGLIYEEETTQERSLLRSNNS